MAKLFFSYSHKDGALRNELQTHLEALRRSGAIETWHDRQIPVGDEIDPVIDQQLEDADVILLLVSSDFLASSYCHDVEVKRAMERHNEGSVRVIPVILRPCDWKNDTPFRNLLATPSDGRAVTQWPNQDEAFLDIVTEIRKALASDAGRTKPQTATESLSAAQPEPVDKVPTTFAPRSSNLRVTQEFTEAQKDRFMDESFDYIAKFFEGSLNELQKRYPDIETSFQRVGPEHFTAVIYKIGEAVSRCSICYGSSSAFGSGITYSHADRGHGNSFNEALNIEVGDQSLSLKPIGLSSMMGRSEREAELTQQGAAEFYWAKLMEPLQRT